MRASLRSGSRGGQGGETPVVPAKAGTQESFGRVLRDRRLRAETATPAFAGVTGTAYVPTETAVCSVERSSRTPGPMVEDTAARRR